MPKKIISLDELSRFKSKYDTKVSGELALKSDKTYVDSEIGSLKDYTDGKLATKEDSTNKVTSLSGSSTDTQYPSAKCVYDNIQNALEVAEGKCKAFKVSYTETEPTQENFIANRWKKIDGTPIATWNDFVEWTTTSDNVRMTYANPDFNSSNEELDLSPSYFITTTYIVVRDEDVNMGDIVLITQLNVPDRWVGGEGLYNVLESTSLDPSGYVDDITIAPAYSNQLTYAVGDLVIYDHKLYRCITAVSSAEDFDSNKWVQASVSDTFVDLYRSQTISGVKSISNRLDFHYGSLSSYWWLGQEEYGAFVVSTNSSWHSVFQTTCFRPAQDNTLDLGRNDKTWKDIYLSGGFNSNANGYKLTLPNTTNLTANSELLDTASAQTISGVKTIVNELDFKYQNNSNVSWKIKAAGDYSFYIQRDNNVWFSLITTQGLGLDYTFYPLNINKDLGRSGNSWRDLYLSRNLTDGTNSVSVAGISNGLFNVINATDIVNNTLTQAQYDLITNGKPTLIKGTLFSCFNPLITNFTPNSDNSRWHAMMISTEQNARTQIQQIRIVVSGNTYTLQIPRNVGAGRQIRVFDIEQLNGKAIPDYPSSTGTFVLKCVDGVLTWVAE